MAKESAVAALVRAMRDADAYRRVLAAKGFKRKTAELKFSRVDADLYWDSESRKWVCDLFSSEGNERIAFATRKANEMLCVLIKSFI